ncbi:MAG: BatD family protein, partial [Elusimicrobiota bacterium]|nr:BatD family protein [Elusimicrobiota bacterium]
QIIYPAILEATIEEQVSNDNFWGIPFFSKGKTVKLETNKLKIDVKPLPNINKPTSFSGAVGDYKMSAKILENENYKVGEPIIFDVTISGVGNVNTINPPIFENTQNFRVYEPVEKVEVKKDENGLKGSKNFRIMIVPLVQGEQKVPNIKFSFFNFKTKKYVELAQKFDDINIQYNDKVETENIVEETKVDSKSRKSKIIKGDIRFIKTKTNLKLKNNLETIQFYKNISFWIIFFIPILFYVMINLVINFNKRKHKYNHKNKNINKQSSLFIKKLDKLQENIVKNRYKNRNRIGNTSYALNEIFEIFLEYLKNRFILDLNYHRNTISMFEIKKELAILKIDISIQNDIENFWNEIEYYKFTNYKIEKKEELLLIEKLKNLINKLIEIK